MLPDDLEFDDFSSCDYLPLLQKVLFDELDESVTYESFVIVPEALSMALNEQYGNEVEINGPFVSFTPVLLLSSCHDHDITFLV
jgi:hypothetical protein